MDNLFSKNVTPLCGLNLGAEHRDICSKFIENNYLGAAHRDICSKYHQKQNKKVQMVHSDLTEAPRNRMQRMLYYLFKMFALRIIYTNIIL